jgi:hypothetical protein
MAWLCSAVASEVANAKAGETVVRFAAAGNSVVHNKAAETLAPEDPFIVW